MKNLTYILILVILVATTSCEKFLDTKPKDFPDESGILNTKENLERALAGIYKTLGSANLYGLFLFHTSGSYADEAWDSRANNSTNTYANNSIQGYSHNTAAPDIYGFWKDLYVGIQRANLLLANLPASSADENLKTSVEGEARFLRAYYYFLLVTHFGDVPLITDLNYLADPYLFSRTPSVEIYNWIVNEMQQAEQNVPKASDWGYGGRVSKSAVQGILARVYLHWAGYPVKDESKYAEAKKWAEKVIGSGEHQLNPSYENIFIKYAKDEYDIKESIFEVEFNVLDASFYKAYGFVGNNNGIRGFNSSATRAYLRVTGRLWNFYNASDKRRDWVISNYIYTSGSYTTKTTQSTSAIRNIYGLCPGKWRREYENVVTNSVATPQNFPLLRYSDVLLMYAEADNAVNNGPTKQGMDYVNLVRRRGYKIASVNMNEVTPADLNYLDYNKTEFVDKVLYEERSRELCFEGLRQNDLIRWGKLIQTIQDVSNAFPTHGLPNHNAMIRGTNISEKNLLFPIPQLEYSLNRNLLPNNKGWE